VYPALTVGDNHIHVGQVGFSCILGAITVGIDKQVAVGIPPVRIEKIVAIHDTRTAENNTNAVVIAAITVLGGYMICRIGFGDRVSSNR